MNSAQGHPKYIITSWLGATTLGFKPEHELTLHCKEMCYLPRCLPRIEASIYLFLYVLRWNTNDVKLTFFCFFKREKKGERKRGRETSMWERNTSHTCPVWRLDSPQELNQWPFALWDNAQTMESHCFNHVKVKNITPK